MGGVLMTTHEEGPTAGGRSPDDPHEWGNLSSSTQKLPRCTSNGGVLSSNIYFDNGDSR